jgi:hypothetical protein
MACERVLKNKELFVDVGAEFWRQIEEVEYANCVGILEGLDEVTSGGLLGVLRGGLNLEFPIRGEGSQLCFFEAIVG